MIIPRTVIVTVALLYSQFSVIAAGPIGAWVSHSHEDQQVNQDEYENSTQTQTSTTEIASVEETVADEYENSSTDTNKDAINVEDSVVRTLLSNKYGSSEASSVSDDATSPTSSKTEKEEMRGERIMNK